MSPRTTDSVEAIYGRYLALREKYGDDRTVWPADEIAAAGLGDRDEFVARWAEAETAVLQSDAE